MRPLSRPAAEQDPEPAADATRGALVSPSALRTLVARQAIFDAQFQVVAYELLYRSPTGNSAGSLDAGSATSAVLIGAVLDVGLDKLVGNHPAHVNFPAELLERDSTLGIAPSRLIVEVLETVLATPAVMNGIVALRRAGYRIAIDDYVPATSDARLLECADIVKFDLGSMTAEEAAVAARPLIARGVVCLAEKVETREQFETCRAAGITQFQGYLLQRPETFFGQQMPVSGLAAVQLLVELNGMDWTLRDAAKLVSSDPGLSYKILRALQSANTYATRRVNSITEAIAILGRDQLVRMVALLALARFGERPPELIRNALLRARICELLAESAFETDTSAYFMTGLLSLVPALVGQSADVALGSLPLAHPISRALLFGEGDLGEAIGCVCALERGHWEGVHFMDLSQSTIQDAYLQACAWLEASMGTMTN